MSRSPNPQQTRRSRLALPILAATALAAAGAGCGGDEESTLTKAEVIEQGSAICDRARQRVDELPQPSEHPFAKGSPQAEQQAAREFLLGQAAAFRSVADGFGELSVPEEGREPLDQFIEEMGGVGEQLEAASTLEPQQVEKRAEKAYARFVEAGERASEYGFPEGTCGVGSNG
jgi:nitrous oxide reductase accessory protein NosL